MIVTLSASSAKETRHEMGGFSLANAAVEALTRTLAGEFGRRGVRVVGLRSNFTPETYPGVTDELLVPLLKDTLLGRAAPAGRARRDRGVPGLGRGRRDERRDGESHLRGHHRLTRLAGSGVG